MVKEVKHKGKIYFQCEACDLYYENREIAQKCEDFCNEKQACNTEIIKYSVRLDDK